MNALDLHVDLDLHSTYRKMFYRQKINELCYMYNLFLNFSIYVHVSDIQLSKNECVAFAEIGWTLQGLNTLLLIFFSCLSEFASGLPGPPHRFFLRAPRIIVSSRAANFNNRNTAARRSSIKSVKGRSAITACHNTQYFPFLSTLVCAQLLPSYLLHRFICYYFL